MSGNIQINKCDKCGTEARSDTQKDAYDHYETIRMNIESYYSSSWKNTIKNSSFMLCEKCLNKIGIFRKEKEDKSEQTTIEQDLFNIIAEIVASEVSNQTNK
jgi:hypothetical protein